MSCTDLLVYLAARYLRLPSGQIPVQQRDYLFLSKGHAVPALYGAFVEIGLLEASRLQNHLRSNDIIYWHPNPQLAGVDHYSGSLGHLLPVALGVALDCKIAGTRQANRQPAAGLHSKVVVVTGDGELNEGSNWEACLVASAKQLDNLIIVVDRNGFQANLRTEDLLPLDDLISKFQAFGCSAIRIDGHDFAALERAFHRMPLEQGRPSVIIADTVRGRGVPSMEHRADRWYFAPTPDEAQQLLEELELHRHATRRQGLVSR
jgi:transketolase